MLKVHSFVCSRFCDRLYLKGSEDMVNAFCLEVLGNQDESSQTERWVGEISGLLSARLMLPLLAASLRNMQTLCVINQL